MTARGAGDDAGVTGRDNMSQGNASKGVDDQTVLSVRRANPVDTVAMPAEPGAPADTVISRRRLTPEPASSDTASIASADTVAASPSGRTAYSPDATTLSAPYPPRAADPVIANRTTHRPTRV